MKEIDALKRLAHRSRRIVNLLELRAPPLIIERERELIRAAIEEWERPFREERHQG